MKKKGVEVATDGDERKTSSLFISIHGDKHPFYFTTTTFQSFCISPDLIKMHSRSVARACLHIFHVYTKSYSYLVAVWGGWTADVASCVACRGWRATSPAPTASKSSITRCCRRERASAWWTKTKPKDPRTKPPSCWWCCCCSIVVVRCLSVSLHTHVCHCNEVVWCQGLMVKIQT